MPQKTEVWSIKVTGLIEAFKDVTVTAAITCTLGPFIAQAIDCVIDKKLCALQETITNATNEGRDGS